AGSDVRLHTQNRRDPGLPGLLLEQPRAMHHAMVRQRERGLLQLLRPRDQVSKAIRTVQERAFRVAVKMTERHSLQGSCSRRGEPSARADQGVAEGSAGPAPKRILDVAEYALGEGPGEGGTGNGRPVPTKRSAFVETGPLGRRRPTRCDQ